MDPIVNNVNLLALLVMLQVVYLVLKEQTVLVKMDIIKDLGIANVKNVILHAKLAHPQLFV